MATTSVSGGRLWIIVASVVGGILILSWGAALTKDVLHRREEKRLEDTARELIPQFTIKARSLFKQLHARGGADASPTPPTLPDGKLHPSLEYRFSISGALNGPYYVSNIGTIDLKCYDDPNDKCVFGFHSFAYGDPDLGVDISKIRTIVLAVSVPGDSATYCKPYQHVDCHQLTFIALKLYIVDANTLQVIGYKDFHDVPGSVSQNVAESTDQLKPAEDPAGQIGLWELCMLGVVRPDFGRPQGTHPDPDHPCSP